MMGITRRPVVIQAYKTLEWSEIFILGALTIILGLVVESSFLDAPNVLISLTISTPFITGALAFKHYEWEPMANRISAMFVAAVFGMGLQVLLALCA
jgi:hypothetical protein